MEKNDLNNWFYRVVMTLILLAGMVSVGYADSTPITAYAGGKYNNLIQVLNCPADRAKYGNYNDYGYWKGGAWCGQQGKAGNWIYNFPNWYVFQNNVGSQSSANGRYGNLIQVLTCPSDRTKYGEHNNYGWWKGGNWCGQNGVAGFWVYQYPSWYVWNNEL